MANCTHLHVQKMDGEWKCFKCPEVFIPMSGLQQIEEESDRMLDMVTAVFSATIWDLHQKAFAAHGVPLPASDPVREPLCEERGSHDMDNDTGRCKVCGHSPFLGA